MLVKEYYKLVREECVRQRNEVAIKLGISWLSTMGANGRVCTVYDNFPL